MLSLATSPEDCEVIVHKLSNSYLCRMVKQTQDLQIAAVLGQGLWPEETAGALAVHTHILEGCATIRLRAVIKPEGEAIIGSCITPNLYLSPHGQ